MTETNNTTITESPNTFGDAKHLRLARRYTAETRELIERLEPEKLTSAVMAEVLSAIGGDLATIERSLNSFIVDEMKKEIQS